MRRLGSLNLSVEWVRLKFIDYREEGPTNSWMTSFGRFNAAMSLLLQHHRDRSELRPAGATSTLRCQLFPFVAILALFNA